MRKREHEILTDPSGRIIGTYTITGGWSFLRQRGTAGMVKRETEYATRFLIGILKEELIKINKREQGEKEMTENKKTDNCNLVLIAGTIFKIDVRDKYGYVLVDTGEKSKVPLKCFDKKILADLGKFEENDSIKLHATVNQSKNEKTDSWELLLKITAIRCAIPERKKQVPKGYEKEQDGLPF